MANYRLKLSDSTTTIDLYSGSDSIVRMFGLSMPPPPRDSAYISSPESDGDRLARSRYKNRDISVTIKIVGTSLSDLKANVRSIHRLLNDARQRTLLGYGARVYLEYQWGDSAGQSVYFDILQGELVLPTNYFSPWLTASWTIADAVLNLECRPFGRFTNQDIAQATLENEDYSTNHNYQDIATAAGHGDIPAKMYLKLALTGATGAKKMWVAKRTGSRQTDDLWTQGEDESSTTEIFGAVTFSDESDAALSGDAYKRALLKVSAGGVPAETKISRLNYVLSTPPRGHFRVLAYCRSTKPTDAAVYADMAWGLGYSYGDKTKAPSKASGEYHSNIADNTWGMIDLGEIFIPPIAESDIALINSLELRIYQLTRNALIGTDNYADPTAFNDPDNGWTDEALAYDNSEATSAVTYPGAATWSKFLEFSRAAVGCIGIRFKCYATGADVVTDVDVDVYYDSGWHHVYEGAYTEDTWTTKYLSEGAKSATKIRIRLKVDAAVAARLREIDFVTPVVNHQWDLDYVFLLPIDEGVVIVDDVAAADVLVIDGITDPPNVFILSVTGKIEDYPDYVGKPFTLGREDTRLYILRDDVKGVTFASDVKYQPQFLVI